MGEQQRYFAYLVRLWTVRRDDKWIWRASAVNAHTGEQHAFVDLDQMFTFLTMLTERDAASSPTDETDASRASFAPPVSST